MNFHTQTQVDMQLGTLNVTGLPEIEGLVTPGFEGVRDTLAMHLESGEDIGAAVTILIDSEPVLDIWGGYFDGTFTRKWERDTIVCCHSITKTMSALCALLLADRGKVDLDAPVAKYWPDFAANGKERIPVRSILGHTSGMAGWSDDVTWDDVYDVEKSSALLAKQPPWWKPGTASGYHGITHGHLIDGIVRRVTGKSLGRFFTEEIAGPLGADFRIGTGPAHDNRVSPLIQAVPKSGANGNWMYDRVDAYPRLHPTVSNSVPFRRAEVGAVNGHGNARAIATINAVLVNDEVNGLRLLSKAGRERVLEPQSEGGVDLLLGIPMVWGMGYALHSPLVTNPPESHIAYWGGQGGHLSFVDFDVRMSIGYTINRWMFGRYELVRMNRIIDATYACLAKMGTVNRVGKLRLTGN